ncbi:hypothetical protein BOW53_15310 [Solemya pervernicosa gill symbiont]|uniref:diguanylate cyclase n=2 Tax=Gammaproteobacteria incertae sedis TaxID=118884 RepID=A0A1T2L075_9GAMM|nr:hypothetical protein BOW53_15310 [Solemya pervernicosa gill symbiont]QKQ26799.1 GGDEF domain-containing protein [Candidatus Reidiella endopervernicosa]
MKRARRYEKPLSVILCDLDNFKQINDSYGHQVGDEVLIVIARLILKSVRVTDFAGRWGGEEFMIICPESDLNQAIRVAEKLRMEIEMQPFSEIGQRTSSFGVASFVLGDDIDAMLKRADRCTLSCKKRW